MYAWKCWRETRARFFVFLTLVVTCMVMLASAIYKAGHDGVLKSGPGSGDVVSTKDTLILVTMGLVWAIAFLSAYLLGATAPGGEMEAGTAEYLWTRPRGRAQMSWTHWGICVAELAVIVFLPMTLLAAIVMSLTGGWKPWMLLLATPVLVFVTLPVLGLTALMTAIRRSANGGLIFGAGIFLGYGFLSSVTQRVWGFPLPQFSVPLMDWFSGVAGAASTPVAFPWGTALRVAVVGVACPLVAQYLLERAEV